MTAKILYFKDKDINLLASCKSCGMTWNTSMPKRKYSEKVNKNQKSICPNCGNITVKYRRTFADLK